MHFNSLVFSETTSIWDWVWQLSGNFPFISHIPETESMDVDQNASVRIEQTYNHSDQWFWRRWQRRDSDGFKAFCFNFMTHPALSSTGVEFFFPSVRIQSQDTLLYVVQYNVCHYVCQDFTTKTMNFSWYIVVMHLLCTLKVQCFSASLPVCNLINKRYK